MFSFTIIEGPVFVPEETPSDYDKECDCIRPKIMFFPKGKAPRQGSINTKVQHCVYKTDANISKKLLYNGGQMI